MFALVKIPFIVFHEHSREYSHHDRTEDFVDSLNTLAVSTRIIKSITVAQQRHLLLNNSRAKFEETFRYYCCLYKDDYRPTRRKVISLLKQWGVYSHDKDVQMFV